MKELTVEEMAFEYSKIMEKQYLKENAKIGVQAMVAEAVDLAIALKKEVIAAERIEKNKDHADCCPKCGKLEYFTLKYK